MAKATMKIAVRCILVDEKMDVYSHAEKVYATTLQIATPFIVKITRYNALDSIPWLATLLS